MGGKTENPTYEQVSSGATGHTEVVNVKYDPAIVSYQELLDYYWGTLIRSMPAASSAIAASQYRPAIFVYDDAQSKLADASKKPRSTLASSSTTPMIVEIQSGGGVHARARSRIITRPTRCAINSTAPVAGETRASSSCGAGKPGNARPANSADSALAD